MLICVPDRWEYCYENLLDSDEDMVERLNVLGADGWEMICQVEPTGQKKTPRFWLKRTPRVHTAQ